MIKAEDVSKKLQSKMGMYQHDGRNYLGMSSIGRCPFQQYRNMIHAGTPNMRNRWFSFTGYVHEAAVKLLLGYEADAIETFLGETAKLSSSNEDDRTIVASFDDRFRGHYDFRFDDKTLGEIKSTTFERARRIFARGRSDFVHFAQCQAYMRHGGFIRAILIYVVRDIPYREFYEPLDGKQYGAPCWYPPFLIFEIKPVEHVMDELDYKARTILAAVDAGVAPDCLCGRCNTGKKRKE